MALNISEEHRRNLKQKLENAKKDLITFRDLRDLHANEAYRLKELDCSNRTLTSFCEHCNSYGNHERELRRLANAHNLMRHAYENDIKECCKIIKELKHQLCSENE